MFAERHPDRPIAVAMYVPLFSLSPRKYVADKLGNRSHCVVRSRVGTLHQDLPDLARTEVLPTTIFPSRSFLPSFGDVKKKKQHCGWMRHGLVTRHQHKHFLREGGEHSCKETAEIQAARVRVSSDSELRPSMFSDCELNSEAKSRHAKSLGRQELPQLRGTQVKSGRSLEEPNDQRVCARCVRRWLEAQWVPRREGPVDPQHEEQCGVWCQPTTWVM